jgi:hypothetical protein
MQIVSPNKKSAAPPTNTILWAGRVISGFSVTLFVATGLFPFINSSAIARGMSHFGYSEDVGKLLGILEILCTGLYVYPRTAVLGAIFLTGYLGAATCSHVRIGEPATVPLLVAAFVWLGIYLREPRLRAIAPVRK